MRADSDAMEGGGTMTGEQLQTVSRWAGRNSRVLWTLTSIGIGAGLYGAMTPSAAEGRLRAQQTGPAEVLTKIQDRYPRWSADGSRVVFYSNRLGGADLFSIALDGSDIIRITDDPLREVTPVPSPNGQRIAYTVDDGQEDLWLLDLATATRSRFTSHESQDGDPEWAPDGAALLFTSNRSGAYEIWEKPLDGGALRKLTDDPRRDGLPAVSPDGRFVAFQRTMERSNADIMVIPRDGGEAVNVSSDPTWDGWPSWSPDGEWVLFASNRSGTSQLWEARRDGSEVRQVTEIDGFSVRRAHWSTDGLRLVTNAERQGDDNTYIVVLSGPALLVSHGAGG